MLKKLTLAASLALTPIFGHAGGSVEGYSPPDKTGFSEGKYHPDDMSCIAYGQRQESYTCVQDDKIIFKCVHGTCYTPKR